MAVNIHAILGRDHGCTTSFTPQLFWYSLGFGGRWIHQKLEICFFNVKNLQELTSSYLTRFVNHPKYDEYRFMQISPQKGMMVFSRHGYGTGDCKLERVLCSYIGYFERCPSPWPYPTVMLHHHLMTLPASPFSFHRSFHLTPPSTVSPSKKSSSKNGWFFPTSPKSPNPPSSKWQVLLLRRHQAPSAQDRQRHDGHLRTLRHGHRAALELPWGQGRGQGRGDSSI